MPSARELLEQADALMRRNRDRAFDAGIPELTEVVAADAPGPGATLIALADVPELADAVEDIEFASMAELPDDIDELSGGLPRDPGDWGETGSGPASVIAGLPLTKAHGSEAGSAQSLWSSARRPEVATDRTLAVEQASPVVEPLPPAAESVPPEPAIAAQTRPALRAPIADDWARWEALAEEIRMQVLQRIDIFTDTRLRKQLSAQLQPIVDRASVQMVETINEEVGKLLRAYIAEAIEREIDKWRGAGE
jgi:hypothetical protein